ncbi:TetR/AcrR family transcriptional regulator [Mesorhizobium sp. ES1-3]|uniref:TetR/AcrR family transcriptional regulator n=1 Tax=Mesorhizobium sp. ES1-3 TaxID=2876628 RepID=UPI001CCD9FD1|nr:TetR/AcrR family transcriptional regulator [Mesorhizobium sp. ES1-3]MBZ9674059.1 TetR/AcrR family transcriptional regulator [Mesorhizobium sp. ES1-3]
MHSTKQHLIQAGLIMLLEQGYNGLGIQALLDATDTPKGSFYHHFRDKEDFALQVLDTYMAGVHAGLDASLLDEALAPLARIRRFFDRTQESYRQEGYLGCLMGGLGQELSGVSEVFRRKIDWCLSSVSERIAKCLSEAQRKGDVPAACNVHEMADLLVNCWEGAALRSRLRRDPASLIAMLDFYINAVASTTRAP